MFDILSMENWEDRQACLLQSSLYPSVELFYSGCVLSMTLCRSRIFKLLDNNLDNLTWQDSKLNLLRVHIHCIFKKEVSSEACFLFFFSPDNSKLSFFGKQVFNNFFFFSRKNLRKQILLVIATLSSVA